MQPVIAISQQMPVSGLAEVGARGVEPGSWEVAVVLATTLAALSVLNLAAPALGLLDHPDGARKRHARPVPMTGGLAIMAGVGLGAMFGLRVGATPMEVVALLAIVAVIHAFDDQSEDGHHGLSARQRLTIDAVVALAFIAVTGSVINSFGTAGGMALGLGVLAVPFTILIYLAVTNAYNMIDGLDGLALSQFLIAFVGIGLWHASEVQAAELTPPALSIIVACLVVLAANLGLLGGFLRCFLGDSGARLLGFFLVYLLVSDGGRLFAPPGAVFFVAVPLLDLCAVVGERVRAGEPPMAADRRHLHHLLIDAGVSPGRVVLAMALLSTGFIALLAALHVAGTGDLALIAIFFALAGLYWTGRRGAARLLGRHLASRRVLGPAE